MSSTSNTRIISLYKSRNTILELLETQGYDISEYNQFSINEIDAMYSNSQLDMLLSHTNNGTKVYVKYYFAATKQIRPPILDNILEDLYDIHAILTPRDTLIIIIDDEPNDTILTKVKYIFDREGKFVVIHNIARLQFNLLKHSLVPQMTILSEEETEALKTKYHLKDLSQLSEIGRFDPQALAMCMRPGTVGEFQRKSATALVTKYYRVCV
jgi:DNA-directed RNA polymerase subunit H (RpoH/RPB5)